jgi:signal transduction histidine kinase
MGRLQLAREDEDGAEHLDAVGAAHDRIEAIIEDLLELATEGRAAMEIERVDAEAVSREAWEQVPTADASLVVEAPGTVRADRTRLQQLLENLFRNAVEHGGDDVTVAVRDHPEGVAVDDDGPGLPDETRERLFQPGRSTSDDGTGFGLAIVDRIADAHGWRVATGESEKGGARFVLQGVDES